MRLSTIAWLTVCAIAAADVAGSVIGPQAFAAGDPAAKQEVIAAFERLNALSSYKIKISGHDGSGVWEIINPDKRHIVAKSDKGSIEVYTIGPETRTRYDFPGAPTGWRCVKSQAANRLLFDTGKWQKEWKDEVIRKPDTVIDGMSVRGYGYADPKKEGVLYIGAQNGLPRRFVSDQDNNMWTGDFYDFGVPIAFDPPMCG
ncbi:MAG TPA: hypothetical protein VJT33_18110 [bacterium]|nr:hypothetical protein [bacterium]